MIACLGVGGYFFFTKPKEIDKTIAMQHLDEASLDFTIKADKEGLEALALIADHTSEVTIETITTKSDGTKLSKQEEYVYKKTGDKDNYKFEVVTTNEDGTNKNVVYYLKNGVYYSIAADEKEPTTTTESDFLAGAFFNAVMLDPIDISLESIFSGEEIIEDIKIIGSSLLNSNFKD